MTGAAVQALGWYTPAQVAARTGHTVGQVRQLIANGSIDAVRTGGRVRISRRQLDAITRKS